MHGAGSPLAVQVKGACSLCTHWASLGVQPQLLNGSILITRGLRIEDTVGQHHLFVFTNTLWYIYHTHTLQGFTVLTSLEMTIWASRDLQGPGLTLRCAPFLPQVQITQTPTAPVEVNTCTGACNWGFMFTQLVPLQGKFENSLRGGRLVFYSIGGSTAGQHLYSHFKLRKKGTQELQKPLGRTHKESWLTGPIGFCKKGWNPNTSYHICTELTTNKIINEWDRKSITGRLWSVHDSLFIKISNKERLQMIPACPPVFHGYWQSHFNTLSGSLLAFAISETFHCDFLQSLCNYEMRNNLHFFTDQWVLRLLLLFNKCPLSEHKALFCHRRHYE